MNKLFALIASLLSFTFVPVSRYHLWAHLIQKWDPFTRDTLTSPVLWITLVVSIYVGVRITRGDEVAWWVGLVGATVLLGLRLEYLARVLRDGMAIPLPTSVTLLWLVAFLACLILMKLTAKNVARVA